VLVTFSMYNRLITLQKNLRFTLEKQLGGAIRKFCHNINNVNCCSHTFLHLYQLAELVTARVITSHLQSKALWDHDVTYTECNASRPIVSHTGPFHDIPNFQYLEENRILSISVSALIWVVGNNKQRRGTADEDIITFPFILSPADFTVCGGGTPYHWTYQARSIESTFSPMGHFDKFK